MNAARVGTYGLSVASTAKHLFDLRDVHFLVANFLPRELLERNAALLAELKQPAVELDTFALVDKQLLHDIVDRFVMSPCELADIQRDTRPHCGHLFAGLARMEQR